MVGTLSKINNQRHRKLGGLNVPFCMKISSEPIGSMYDLFTYILSNFMVKVGKYIPYYGVEATIHFPVPINFQWLLLT